MGSRSRYRTEGKARCVDIRLKTASQLFDNRDPAPFRERDLDPSAVDVLMVAAGEIRRQFPIKIVLHFSAHDPSIDLSTLRDAIAAHFNHELDLAERRISDNFRLGRRLLLIGVAVLGMFLTIAELALRLPAGPVREVVREGLTITGWVALWRPVEVLLYDWIPLFEQRRWIRRLLAAEVEVRSTAQASLAPVPQRAQGA